MRAAIPAAIMPVDSRLGREDDKRADGNWVRG